MALTNGGFLKGLMSLLLKEAGDAVADIIPEVKEDAPQVKEAVKEKAPQVVQAEGFEVPNRDS